MRRLFLVALCASVPMAGSLSAQDYYVYHGVLASGDGKSWNSPFKNLSDALRVAKKGDEIWMASGAYRGGFNVPAGVIVRGNFRRGDTRREQRNWSGYTYTALTGYAGQRVMTAGDGALIEGVRISWGKASAPGGGGIHCDGTSPTFRNCEISYCEVTGAGARGSAVLITKNNKGKQAEPRFENCLFTNNGKQSGGAPMIAVDGSWAIFRNCGFGRSKGDGITFDNLSIVGVQNSWFFEIDGRAINDPGRTSRAYFDHNLFYPVHLGYRGKDLKTIAAVNALSHASNNITGDPRVNPLARFETKAGSPLIDAGANLRDLPTTDLLSLGRRNDGDLDGDAIVDIGPYEFSRNRVHFFGTPKPGNTVGIILLDPTGSQHPTIMAIGTRALSRPVYLDPLGYWSLDLSAGSLIVPWGKTASNRQVKIPSSIPVGATIGMQNLAVGTDGASLSNYFEIRLR